MDLLQALQSLLSGLGAGLEAVLEAWRAQAWALTAALAWVALGSACGGLGRFLVSGLVGRTVGETFPWGTLAVNVSGACAIGAAAALAGVHGAAGHAGSWHFAVVGFLGSYTTVSSFSLQTLALARDGEWLRAGGNALASVVLCLSAVTLGFHAARALLG